jgi:hypothetical protein
MAEQKFNSRTKRPPGSKNLTVDIDAPHYTHQFDGKEVEIQYSQQFGESEMRSQKDPGKLDKYNLTPTPSSSDDGNP